MPNNEEKGFASAHINCLSMIYLTPYRNPYKIRKHFEELKEYDV